MPRAFCCVPYEQPELNSNQETILKEMEKLAGFLDANWITICGISFGADSIIGLIPGIGDIVTTGCSLWILMRLWFAYDAWLFRKKWCVMLMNVAVDFTIGSVPLAGDIFDVYWKSNIKNINILRKHYGMEPFDPSGQPSDDADLKVEDKV
mmetsp:Transcript_23550/g.33755  ORF Transcript_23550/g.33755 Transcript_23550/m.33755 type:complete len:151 (-) Transcript_23550:218-670(-)